MFLERIVSEGLAHFSYLVVIGGMNAWKAAGYPVIEQ